MTDHRTHAREGGASLLALAFAGIAAYAGYRAIDAERRVKNPDAKPLFDHIVETAKADLKAFCDKASELGAQIADEAREAGERAREAASDLGDRARAAASEVGEKARAAASDVSDAGERAADRARDAAADAADAVGDAAHDAASGTRPH